MSHVRGMLNKKGMSNVLGRRALCVLTGVELEAVPDVGSHCLKPRRIAELLLPNTLQHN